VSTRVDHAGIDVVEDLAREVVAVRRRDAVREIEENALAHQGLRLISERGGGDDLVLCRVGRIGEVENHHPVAHTQAPGVREEGCDAAPIQLSVSAPRQELQPIGLDALGPQPEQIL